MGWSRFFRRAHWDEERVRELEAYLEAEAAENVSRGMPEREARAAALRKLGNPTSIREEIYRMNSFGFAETLWQDLRYGLRVLRKSPGFAAVAVLSLALGIGANSAVFSVIHAVLLRPLPYPQADQLVRADVRMAEYDFWKDHSAAFASFAGNRGTADRSLVAGTRQEWIKAMTVTGDFFRTLGVAPALGREFNSEETRRGGPRAVVLSDGLWRSAFAGDPGVLGRAVALDESSFTVVGVLPRGFWFPQAADAFVPLRPTGSMDDQGINTEMIARLKPGVKFRQAEAEIPALAEDLRRQHPDIFKADYRGLALTPYQDWLVGDVRSNMLLLFGAVGLLLLIACSNLAGLLLARLAGRRKEIAMRLALGSSRGRLLRQFLVENILLTVAGGLAGLLAARTFLDGLVASIPFKLTTAAPISLDPPVLVFTLAVALATGLAFSLAPILTASRFDLQEALKSGGRSAGAARQRTRSILVMSETALSVTLLVSAGLLIQSLHRMNQERLGFTPRGLIAFATPFAPERRRSGAEQWRYESALLQRFQGLARDGAVAAINVLPLGGRSNLPAQREGHPEHSFGAVEIRFVTPSYFELMGIPVRRGRGLLGADMEASPAVLMVNETLARQWWPNGDPVGDRVVLGRLEDRDYGQPLPAEVVGIAGDTKTRSEGGPPGPTVYLAAAQKPDAMGSTTWVLRANLSPGLIAELRRTIAEIDPRQRVGAIRTMDEMVASATAGSRFDAWLFAFLAGLALALTAIGLYGLLSYSVARRVHEIGTRMALGASRGSVMALVLRQGIALTVIGLLAGLAGALVATRWLSTLLFGVTSTDPASFAGVAALLVSVGLLASYFPARRATRVDPMVALRDE